MLRSFLKSVVAALIAVVCITACKDASRITVMSFNIRVCPDDVADGGNNWTYRRDAVVRMLNQSAPDLIGIQEGLYPQVNYMADRLPEYERFGVERPDAQERGEANAIFVRKERFSVMDKGTFWLSDTPDTVSRGWDAAYNRTAVWMRLRETRSGREFLIVNTHFDHIGDTARMEASRLVIAKIRELAEDGLPVFLTGDFNSNYDSRYLEPLREYLQNGRETAPQTCDYNTFNDWGTIAPDSARNSIIDHIFYRNASPSEYVVLAGDYGAAFVSDHYPIALTAEI